MSADLDKVAQTLAKLSEFLPWDRLSEEGREHYRTKARECLLATLPVSNGAIDAFVDGEGTGMIPDYHSAFAAAIKYIIGAAS